MRILAKLFASFFILIIISLSVIFVLLHTRHATQVFTALITPILPGTLTAEQVDYHWQRPLHLTLTQPNYQYGHQHWQANTARVQFSVERWSHLQWVRIDGLSLDLTDRAITSLDMLPATLTIGRVLFNDLSLQGQGWQAQQVSAQLDDWHKGQAPLGSVRGRAQWEAKQVDWHGLQASQLLVDATPAPNGWQFRGVSFEWQSAAISTQGHWQPGALALTQLTLSDVIIDGEDTYQRVSNALLQWPHTTTLTIDRTDIRQLSAETEQFSVNGLTLSAEHITIAPKTPWWQQPKLRASFNADYIRWHTQTWDQPLGDIERHGESWVIHQLTSQWQEGFVGLSGHFSKRHWQIDKLQANNLTLSHAMLSPLMAALPEWPETLFIDDVSLKHNQWLALSPQFPIKISGIDVNGRALQLSPFKQWRLTDGSLTASASHASINQHWLAEPYLRLDADQGKLTLQQLLLGFPDGQLAVSGTWDLSAPSQPWSLLVDGLQIPLSVYQDWFDWPLPLTGFHDIEAKWSGLAADRESFNVGLNGEMDITFLDAKTHADSDTNWATQISAWLQPPSPKKDKQQTFPFETLSIDADRGQLTGALQGETRLSIQWPIYRTDAPRIR